MFSRKRNRYYGGPRRLAPWHIVLICVGIAIIVTVVVGNLLKVFLDEETYQNMVHPQSESNQPEPAQTYLPDVHALPFVLGNSVDELEDRAVVSVSINDPDGSLNYSSPVSQKLGLAGNDSVAFEDALSALSMKASYISGVFYTQACNETSSDTRFAVGGTECALIREFVRAGGGEVILLNLPLTLSSLPQVTDYTSRAKSALEDCALGVAVPFSVAKSEDGWEIIGTLLKVCDFCALDLREMGDAQDTSTILNDINYFLSQYDMRLLISETQTALKNAIQESDIVDYQIISAEH